jgi:hypothetical protein
MVSDELVGALENVFAIGIKSCQMAASFSDALGLFENCFLLLSFEYAVDVVDRFLARDAWHLIGGGHQYPGVALPE